MAASVIVTQRKVKNATGVDINVPRYAPAESARDVKYFQVVVVSKLPHFKNEEHSDDDIVQFMVQRDYEAFEKLQKELIQQYPGLKLPMPRKHFLFINEDDLEDRRFSFDCLLTVVAKSKDLCTSIPVLIFLGIDLLADRKYAKRRKEYLKKKEEKDIKKPVTANDEPEDLFTQGNGNNDDEVEEDLFKDPPENLNTNIDETSERLASVKVSLLSDDVNFTDALLVGEKESKTDDSLFSFEEDTELDRITDSLDDVPIAPITTKKSNPPPSKPSTAKKAIKDVLFDDDSETNSETAKMGTNDVMQYIMQNQTSADDDDLSLF